MIGGGVYFVKSNDSIGNSATPPSSTPTSPSPAPASSTPAPLKPLVLAISVDGLNPEAIIQLGKAGAPNFHRLMAEGASTLNARSAYELTITLPNHTGMLTGRRVAGPDGHNVTFNSDNDKTLNSTHGTYVPGLFDLAHDEGLKTAFFAQKDKFNYLIRSWDATHGAPDTTGEDDGRDKVDIDAVGEASQMVASTQKALADGTTDLIFLHMRAPDSAGHGSGWLGSSYLKAVRSVDADLGKILETIDGDARVAKRAAILLTADHGGPEGEKSHSDEKLYADYRIPFIAWGRDIAPGEDLYQLNAGRQDPKTSRPGYDGAQPIRNVDLANTALAILRLPSIPGAISSEWPLVGLK